MGTLRARLAGICVIAGVVLIGLAALGPSVNAANNTLSGWVARGGSADWRVQPSGTTVIVAAPNPNPDNANGSPSFFVSPTNMSGTFRISMSAVQQGEEGDYIGFALGYRRPLTDEPCSNTTPCDTEFYLFDWKQTTELVNGNSTPEAPEDGGQEGFSLMKVQGKRDLQNNNTLDRPACFWTHEDVDNACDVLGTRYGSTQGYDYGVGYTFEVTYTPARLRIVLLGTGGAANNTIFDITPPTGTEFLPGRAAFYNYSQPGVEYAVDDGTAPATTTTTTTTTVVSNTTVTTAAPSATTRPTVGPVTRSTLVRTGPDTWIAGVQLAGGAVLLLIGATLTATRGKRPPGRFYV